MIISTYTTFAALSVAWRVLLHDRMGVAPGVEMCSGASCAISLWVQAYLSTFCFAAYLGAASLGLLIARLFPPFFTVKVLASGFSVL